MPADQKKYHSLRSDFPFFVFEGFSVRHQEAALKVDFLFNLSDKHYFKPSFSIENVVNIGQLPEAALNNLVFHIGMAEMISYWKTACSPVIILKPFSLEPKALAWWKKLFFHGLGEFFYTNGITPAFDDFLSFQNEGVTLPEIDPFDFGDGSIIPIGGGKDSVVTLEILAYSGKPVFSFFLNPTHAAINVLKASGLNDNKSIIIKRNIDSELLRLNDSGFLNGHTPFSALLAFYSLLPALITGSRNIVLSNESSANEPTIHGSDINHQYSKSYEFESDFRSYYNEYIHTGFNYFSFLRPLNEYQIAGLFAGFRKYHSDFRSCNAGSKSGVWCRKCPKCLFTFIILSPFLDPDELTRIFGSNLLNDPGLAHYFDQLCGFAEEKPFDCIGTVDEVNAAVQAAMHKYPTSALPFLLNQYRQKKELISLSNHSTDQLLTQFNNAHFVPDSFLNLLKAALHERFS